jgi:uncharacterized protein involved in type VI secretion and phage assembly
VAEAKDGATWASEAFGNGKKIIVDEPVINQAEADILAAAHMDTLSGTFIQAEGRAFRRPEIRAGRTVKLEKLGQRLSGIYLVSQATHHYTSEGLETTFYVRGTRSGLLSPFFERQPHTDHTPGVVPAVVTNTDDPKAWGRIKVKYPWLADDVESDWARVAAPGAGPESGFFSLPEVGDEVLVAFAHGAFGQPYILGGVWNGKHQLPPGPARASKGKIPQIRSWRSRTGHAITTYDNEENKVEVVTAGGHTISLNDCDQKVEIMSKGGLQVSLDDKKKTIVIDANGDINLQSKGKVNITGTTINLNG